MGCGDWRLLPPKEFLSGVIGRSRIRLPVAWKTTLAMARAAPVIPICAYSLGSNGTHKSSGI